MRVERRQRLTRQGRSKIQLDSGGRPASWSPMLENVSSATADRPISAISRRRSCAATRSASSAPTVPARRRCCGCCSVNCRRRAGRSRLGTQFEDGLFRSAARAARPGKVGAATTSGEGPTRRRSAGHGTSSAISAIFCSAERAQRRSSLFRAASATGCCWRSCSRKPANLLVLDEPTNDLDAETLEMLEERLVEFTGHGAAGQPRPGIPQQRGHQHARLRRRRRVTRIRRRLRGLAAAEAGFGAEIAAAAPQRANRTEARRGEDRARGELDAMPQTIGRTRGRARGATAAHRRPGVLPSGQSRDCGWTGRARQHQHKLANAYARWEQLDAGS